MRAVIQKVSHAHVDVIENDTDINTGKIQSGFVVLLGITHKDTEADAYYIAEKITHLRIFEDVNGKLNLSLKDTGSSVLLISQFTLYADARTGRRPSFSNAAKPDHACKLYEQVTDILRSQGIEVQTGQFQTHMKVTLCNDGPVTILLDSYKEF